MSDTMEKTQVPASEVRRWANGKGFEVGTRGHLPKDVIDRFNRAHRTKEFQNGNPWAGRGAGS